MWTLTIPDWCPPSVNVGRGRHFSKSHKATLEVAEHLIAFNATAGVPKVRDDYRPVRRVLLRVVKSGALPDPDNLLKHTLDGLKLAGLIVDDAAGWCQWLTPVVRNPIGGETRRTTFEIEDISPKTPVQFEPLPLVGGLEFTRARVTVRPWYYPHDPASRSRGDFAVYVATTGGDSCFLTYSAATEFELDRLVNWAETLGVPVEREDYTPEPAKPVAADTDFFG